MKEAYGLIIKMVHLPDGQVCYLSKHDPSCFYDFFRF